MGWADTQARLHRAVHRTFELQGSYEAGGVSVPVRVNLRRIPATTGEGDEVEMVDDIIEIDLLLAEVPEPVSNAKVVLAGRNYRLGPVLRRTADIVTVEVS